MQTNNIKSFAKKARLILLDGVSNRLKYWGFNDDGSCSLNVEPTEGGYTLRGQVFNDETVPTKWNNLKKRIKDKQSVQDVIEEAAYTWFNRLMAIKILENNEYIPKQLDYANGTRTPMIVQNAKRGQHNLKKQSFITLLHEQIKNNKEEEALNLLLTRLCNNHKLLHDVFGRIDDYTELLLPQNLLQKDGLMDLINSDFIAPEDYKEVELIGWLYQFYISDKKDKVFADFKKNKKARAEDIPAATQIFTPKWIVKYMVENTVGKLYLDYEPSSAIKQDMKYLVENENDQNTSPVISDITELTLLDPASGSGHILVSGFDLLMNMYKEEGYASGQAVENILKHNLWGLDIDDRAVQLAQFALLLKAAKYNKEILNKSILPHIYSFPAEEHFISEELHSFLGNEGLSFTAELKEALGLLNKGKNVGSALKVDISPECREYIKKRYTDRQQKEKTASLDLQEQEIWHRLKPFIDVLLTITNKFTAVVANPPYMGQKNMNPELKEYVNKQYPISKSDLFAVFIESMIGMVKPQARMGCITMEAWMFLSSYEKLRNKILNNYSIVSLAHFGWHIIGIAFGTAALILEKSKKIKIGEYSYLTIDDIERTTNTPYVFPKKDNGRFNRIPQSNFSKIPGSPIAYWVSERVVYVFESFALLEEVGEIRQGLISGNNERFVRNWFEVNFHKIKFKWFTYNKGGGFRKWYGNLDLVINWENNGEEIKQFKDNSGKLLSRPQSASFYFKDGISWSRISSGNIGFRKHISTAIFADAAPTIFPQKNNVLLLSLLNSVVTNYIVKVINPTLTYQVGDIKKIPYVSNVNSCIDDFTSKNISISKIDWDSRETSWDFQKSPLLNESTSLAQAYQNWQQDVIDDFFQLHANEEELNSIFIDIYGLQDELTPDVPLKDITILQDELDGEGLKQLDPVFREQGKDAVELPIKKEVVLSQFVSYCIGVMMGRYRLDKPGLNIAHPNPTEEELASYSFNGQKIETDNDAIVPLMGKDCNFSDDALLRLKSLILAIWGEDTLIDNLNFLQECFGTSPNNWLTEKFWSFHTKMYKKKPIYWLFASNPQKPQKAAFKVLVYMHRMNRFTVQQIQRNYLYPHQEYIKREIKKLKDNEGNLGKQESKRLEMLLDWEVECRNYNEILKDLANKQIEFDLDDGVSVNYAKFEGAVANI